MADRDVLQSMGFSQERVTAALRATKNAGLQPALDWLVAHAEDPVEGEAAPTAQRLGGNPGSSSGAVLSAGRPPVAQPPSEEEIAAETASEPTANSLQCDDCGRLLRDTTAAQAHAQRTQHQNFSQSTQVIQPLTEEEKKQKLEELRARMEAKRAEREQQEKAEAKQREAMRRITGKEISKAKELAQEQEMKRALELKKREKQEEKEARDRIKAQIEQDRLARAQKAEEEKRLRSGGVPAAATQAAASSSAGAPTQTPSAAAASANYDETRLQFRSMVAGVAPLTQTFRAQDTLQTVFDYLLQQGVPCSTLSTTFPRREYSTATNGGKTLKELELVPSAALVMRNTA